ncbi:MAG: YbhB/YbcL family Raf kinase inhibitor-like protein [Candidatus Omnitrophota bacterium]
MRYRNFPGYCFVIFLALMFLSVAGVHGTALALELRSSSFGEGEEIPVLYTGEGANTSPGFSWDDVPEGTQSFVLIMYDIDAPSGIWVHWVLYNLPGNLRSIEEGIPPEVNLENGARQGVNSFRKVGYEGPYPPPGPAHRYIFTLYAVDTVLDLDVDATRDMALKGMIAHVLGSAQLSGLYERKNARHP